MIDPEQVAAGRPRRVAEGVYRLPVPVPFALEHVNAYLLEGDPLTLIDSGANIATARSSLGAMLEQVGYRVSDLEVLVVTHQHFDHFGLTGLLAEASGAEVVALEPLADFLEDFHARQSANDRFASALMVRHGVDVHVVDALRTVAGIVQGLGAPAVVSRRVRHGDVLVAGARRLRVLHRPGHSPSDTVFHDEEAGLLFSGDHVLGHVSSNALITRAADGPDDARTRPLLDYRRSLIATRDLGAEVSLGGHGFAVTDAAALIDRRLEQQDQRAAHIRDLLAVRPMTAHEIATSIWGRVAFTQTFLTLSEVLGHLDILVEEGGVRADEAGPVIVFETQ